MRYRAAKSNYWSMQSKSKEISFSSNSIIKTNWRFKSYLHQYKCRLLTLTLLLLAVKRCVSVRPLVQITMIKNPSTSYIHYFYEQFYFINLCLVLFANIFVVAFCCWYSFEASKVKVRGKGNKIKWISLCFININSDDARAPSIQSRH